MEIGVDADLSTALQALRMLAKNSIRQPTQAEGQEPLIGIAMPIMEEQETTDPALQQPAVISRVKFTHTIDAQNGYVQKKIRQNENELIGAWQDGCTEFDRNGVLECCGMGGKNWVDPYVVECCLAELQEEKINYICEFQVAQRTLGFTAIYDVNALSVGRLAEELELVIIEPDRRRGVYVGPMVGEDHRAGLVKYAREKAVELPFRELAVGQAKPRVGSTVRMVFREGVLMVTVTPHPPRRP